MIRLAFFGIMRIVYHIRDKLSTISTICIFPLFSTRIIVDNVDKSVYNSLFSSFTSLNLWITLKAPIIRPGMIFFCISFRETLINTAFSLEKKELAASVPVPF